MADWIRKVTGSMNRGALHRQLGVPEGQTIPQDKLAAAAQAGGKLGERARFAETLKGFRSKGGPR